MSTKIPRKVVNRVWIELDKPESKEHAEEQCRLVNSMLSKLGNMNGNHFFYSEHERRYCFGGNMGSKILTDNGEWFNLDYLGREVDKVTIVAPKLMKALEKLIKIYTYGEECSALPFADAGTKEEIEEAWMGALRLITQIKKA